MLKLNLAKIRVLCLKDKQDDLWKYIDSCASKSWAADYHFENIKVKLEKAKDSLKEKDFLQVLF
jgi:hypothetical protein